MRLQSFVLEERDHEDINDEAATVLGDEDELSDEEPVTVVSTDETSDALIRPIALALPTATIESGQCSSHVANY